MLLASRLYQPEPATVRSARAFVVEQLERAGLGECTDDTAVVVSELVSNVVLHARTPFEVRLAVLGENEIRIEVQDECAVQPAPGTLTATAGSGRGLLLVQALVSHWGSEHEPDGGKTVWCELTCGAEPDADPDALLALWDVPDDDTPGGHGPGEVDGGDREVVVPDLPVQALLAAKAHSEDVLRELQLVLLAAAPGREDGRDDGGNGGGAAYPAELLDAARRLDAAAAVFADVRRQLRVQAMAAAERGEDRMAIHLYVAPDAAAAAREYGSAFTAVEAVLRRLGDPLLVAPDAAGRHAAVRRAYLTAILEQVPPPDPDPGRP